MVLLVRCAVLRLTSIVAVEVGICYVGKDAVAFCLGANANVFGQQRQLVLAVCESLCAEGLALAMIVGIVNKRVVYLDRKSVV